LVNSASAELRIANSPLARRHLTAAELGAVTAQPWSRHMRSIWVFTAAGQFQRRLLPTGIGRLPGLGG
jgi:hypothetical protein